jgi:CHAT domain-containing protein
MNLTWQGRCTPRHFRLGGVLILALMGGAANALEDRSASSPPRTAEQQMQLDRARRLGAQAIALLGQGKATEAIAAAREKLRLERAVYGNNHEVVAQSLQGMALLLEITGEHAAARKALQEIVEILTRQLGKGHWRVTDARLDVEDLQVRSKLTPDQRDLLARAEVLTGRVMRLQEAARYKEAVPLAQEAVAIRSRLLGRQHRDYAQSLFTLGALYEPLGRHHDAELVFRRSLEINEASLGKNHLRVAYCLNGLGVLYQNMGRYDEALRLGQRGLATFEASLGKSNPQVAACLHNLAEVCYGQGRYVQALQYGQRSLEVFESCLGKDSLDSTMSLNALGLVHDALGHYGQAEAFHQRALEIRQTRLGKNHSLVATSLSNLAGLYADQGRQVEAETLFLRSRKTFAACQEKDHSKIGACLNGLGHVYHLQGRYREAEALYQQNLEMCKSRLGENHPLVGACLHNLATLYSVQGRYTEAEGLYQRSLEILGSRLGPDHPNVASNLGGPAELYKAQARYGEAERLYRRSLEMLEARLGKEHPYVATALNNLALYLEGRGGFVEAERFYQRSLQIRRTRLGKDHGEVAETLNNLGLLCFHRGRIAEAEKFLQGSQRIVESRLGKEHPRMAACLSNLGRLREEQGRSADAARLFRRCLTIWEAKLGKDHPYLSETLTGLGVLEAAQEHWTQARRYFDRARRVVRGHLSHVLPGLSPQEQLAFLRVKAEGNLHGALSLALARRADSQLVSASAGWLLNGKAMTQDALAEPLALARLAGTGSVQTMAEQIRETRCQLAKLTFSFPPAGAEGPHRRRLEELEAREQELARKLAQAGVSWDRPKWAELDGVRKVLAKDTVLVDIARVHRFNYQAKEKKRQWLPPVYAAWVIPPIGRGDVELIDLGPADKIDGAVQAVRVALHAAPAQIQRQSEALSENRLKKVLGGLAGLVLRPLAKRLATVNHWVLSPDSSLWLVPWAALPLSDGRYAVENHRITLVVSGRDLLLNPSPTKFGQPLVLADPDFDLVTRPLANEGPSKTGRRGQLPSERLGLFSRLPGTAAEARIIAPFLHRLTGLEPVVRTGKTALESVFKTAHRPRVLVLSTHGFFLEDQADAMPPLLGSSGNRGLKLVDLDEARPQGKNLPVLENPLLRCGLALAGANRRGQIPNGVEDGILTGLEIVGTDLRGTELVVLSACETGLGKVNVGEGVAGLRQAFQLAGAQAVVATLWQIPDQETTALMAGFFENLAAKKGKAEALRLAQLEIINQRRAKYKAGHPFYWAAFNLTGQCR